MSSRLALLLILALFVSNKPYSKASRHNHDSADEKGSESILSPRITGMPFFPILGFRVDDKTANNSRFKREIGSDYALGVLREANRHVPEILGQNSVQRVYGIVNLTVESYRGLDSLMYKYNLPVPVVASTTGKHIQLNSDYLEAFTGDVKFEFNGIVYHETARIWQWTGRGAAPNWLLTGIADYVRLKAGWPSVTWPGRGSGSGIRDGYAVTAYFLEYCSVLRKGFVAELNSMMKDRYDDNYFEKLLGKSIHALWDEYKMVYKKEISPGGSPSPRGGH